MARSFLVTVASCLPSRFRPPMASPLTLRPRMARSAARRVSLLLHALLLLGFGLAPRVVRAQAKGLDDADIMRLKAVGGVALSPDGARVLYTVSAWEHPNAKGDTALGDRHDRRAHVFMVPAAGGAPRQLTFGERGESQPQWSPDGRTIAFVAARGTGTGDDAPRPQLWLLPADGGESRQLTTVREGVSSYVWSPDGSRIALVTTDSLTRDEEAKRRRRDDPQVYEGDFRLNHIWVVDVASGKATKVTSGAYTVSGVPNWSPDGRKLGFRASPTPMIRDERGNAFVVDVASLALDAITTTNDAESAPQFSPDGKTLAFTMLPHEMAPHKDGIMPRTLRNARLVTFDLATRAITNHARADFDVSPGAPRWSPDGKELWFTASDRVWNTLYAYDVAAKRYSARTKDVLVQGLSPSSDGTTLVIPTQSWFQKIAMRHSHGYHPLVNAKSWIRLPIGVIYGVSTVATGAAIVVGGCTLDAIGKTDGALCSISIEGGAALIAQSDDVVDYVLQPDLRHWKNIPAAIYLTSGESAAETSCADEIKGLKQLKIL